MCIGRCVDTVQPQCLGRHKVGRTLVEDLDPLRHPHVRADVERVEAGPTHGRHGADDVQHTVGVLTAQTARRGEATVRLDHGALDVKLVVRVQQLALQVDGR